MKVCIIGLGYIGLPTACLVSQAGHQVVGVDINLGLVERLQAGKLDIRNEPGLGELVKTALDSGGLRFAAEPTSADVFVIAVPTPFLETRQSDIAGSTPGRPPQHHADLRSVFAAVRSIAPYLSPGNLIILESTVPPRTTERLIETLQLCGLSTAQILLAHAPERVLPGDIIQELLHNSRIVGGVTPDAGIAARDFYRTFVQGEVAVTDATTAELVKLMENTFRDVNIALANEMALVCEHLGIDVWEAINLANLHPRVNYLRPGPGVGGHCIAVDPYFVVEAAPTITPLIQVARQVNSSRPKQVLELFRELTREADVTTVAVLGASYKANVGDLRESPAMQIVALLRECGKEVRIHDPYVKGFDRTIESVLLGAETVILATDHSEYRQLDPVTVVRLVAKPYVLDTRGCIDVRQWRAAGLTVKQVGVGERPNGIEV